MAWPDKRHHPEKIHHNLLSWPIPGCCLGALGGLCAKRIKDGVPNRKLK